MGAVPLCMVGQVHDGWFLRLKCVGDADATLPEFEG